MIEHASNSVVKRRGTSVRPIYRRDVAIMYLKSKITNSNAWPLNAKKPHVTARLRESHLRN